MTQKEIYFTLQKNLKFLIENLSTYINTQQGYMEINSSDWDYIQFSIGTNTFIVEGDIQPYDGIDSYFYLNLYQLKEHKGEHPQYRRHPIQDLQVSSDTSNLTMFIKEQHLETPAKFGGPNKFSTHKIDNNDFGSTYCNAIENWLKNNRNKQ